jgi:Xaa-Pro dipeptidase
MSAPAVAARPPATRPFSAAEFKARLKNVRKAMAKRGLDGMLISSPENIFYLTGLNYQGYFAYQLLLVPLSGRPALITRAMEAAIIRDKVPDVEHFKYSDGIVAPPPASNAQADLVMAARNEAGRFVGLRPWSTSFGVPTREGGLAQSHFAEPARVTLEALAACGLGSSRLGFEASSSFFPYGIAHHIIDGAARAHFEDASDLVGECRLVKSAKELELTRAAAAVTDSMLLAAIAAAGPGVPEKDIMASIYQTMFNRGGTWPGFVPLVRTTRTLEHEHGSWENQQVSPEDLLFLEMSGCVERYHAPAGRLVFIGKAPPNTREVQAICEAAIEAAADAIRPGVIAADVYAAWQSRLDGAGLSGYRRHHCGYAVGIGFPPSWSGSGVPVGLRSDSALELKAGMVFHLMSWLLRSGRGDYFISDTVVVTRDGCERLTRVPRTLTIR